MLTKEELIDLVMRSWCDEEGDLNLRLEVNLDDGCYITEEEVREAVELVGCSSTTNPTEVQINQVVRVMITKLFGLDSSDLLDDSEEGEGEYQPDWMISPQGAVHEQSAPCCDGGDCIDPTKPLRVRVADEMQARELSNMAIDAGFSVKGHYCDKNQLLVRPEEESSMWIDKRRENPADFVTDFSDRKPQVEAYLNFHSEEADMTDDELTEHPDRDTDDKEREIAERFMEEGDWMMELFDKETVRIPVVVLHALRSQLELADDGGVCEWTKNEDGDWETGCDFVLAGDAHYPREPNENYCQNCGGEVEIVEEGEPEYEVGDLVRYKGRDPLDNYIITGQHEAGCDDCGCYDSKHFSVLCSTGASGYIPVDKQDNFEQLGAFQPTPEFFERLSQWVRGELMIKRNAGRKEVCMGIEKDVDSKNAHTVLRDEEGGRSITPNDWIERTGIVLSVSELEPIFCEEE
jgi:hypothetical protein